MLTEQELHERQTRRFIDIRPESFIVVRRPHVPTTAGGYTLGAETRLLGQSFRRIAMGTFPARVDENGETVRADFAIIGMPDADLELFDVLESGDDSYRVIYVTKTPNWRAYAEVFRFE